MTVFSPTQVDVGHVVGDRTRGAICWRAAERTPNFRTSSRARPPPALSSRFLLVALVQYSTMRATIGVFLVALSAPLLQARNYEIVFDRVEGHQVDTDYFGPRTGMYVRRFNKSMSVLFDCLEIIKPLPNETISEVILHERHDNEYVPSWLRYRHSFCDYLAHEKRPVFVEIGRIFGFPSSCPVAGVFAIKNYTPDDKLLPPVLPGPEHWKLEFALFVDNKGTEKNLIRHAVVFHIDRTKAILGKGRG